MSKQDQDKLEEIMREVDDATSKDNMTLEQAKDFLEELMGSVESRLDGISDDLRARA